MDLEVRHLRLVTAIVDQGSVTNAANQLNLTQSALSHQLRDIEDRLGVSLFQRLAKRMMLTHAGERLVESARGILDQLHQVETEIRETSKYRQPVLRISTEYYTCYHWLPSKMKLFNEKFPQVEVRIVSAPAHGPAQALLDGRLDVAIVCTKVRNRNLIYQDVLEDELIAVMSPKHPLAGNPYLMAQDFSDQHLITYSLAQEELLVFQNLLVPAGVTPRRISQIELTEGIIEMVKNGMGIGAISRWAAAPHLAAGTIIGIPLTAHGLYRTWSAAILRSAQLPTHVTQFVKLIGAEEQLPQAVRFLARTS